MHDLLVEMGREIVKQESPKHLGKRSRLWNPEEVYDVLKYNKGTEVVEVIFFDIYKIEDLYLRSDSFKSMINLRYLHITCDIEEGNSYIVHLLDGLEWLPDNLRYLYWDAFPLESLPSTFSAKNLVILSMKFSKLKKLWDGIQKLDNLMTLDLRNSKDLIEIPDLSRAPNLQIVNLSYCESLCQLHPSVFTCPKLRELRLYGSKKIETLNHSICTSSLVEFPLALEQLWLPGTAIHEFPSWIWRCSKLTFLNLGGCENLNIVRKKSSTDLGLRSLTTLDLSGCTKINTSNLWFILDGTPCLKELDLRRCCNLETLPNNIQNNTLLEILELDGCSKLKSLPKLPTSLRRLTAFNCTYLDINMLQVAKFHFKFGNRKKMNRLSDICYLPGCQVPCEFKFHTTKTSIVIPPIPKSGLCGFIFCVVLSEGLKFLYDRVVCTINEHGKEIHQWNILFVSGPLFMGELETLNLDHVLLSSWYCNYELVNMGNESEGDHYNLSFEFKYFDIYDKEEEEDEDWSSKGIKGCGVIPVYGLEHSFGLDGRSNSGVEIVELQSNAQVFDEYDQHLKFDTIVGT